MSAWVLAGLIAVGGLESGLTGITVGTPRLAAIGRAEDGRWSAVEKLAPLGTRIAPRARGRHHCQRASGSPQPCPERRGETIKLALEARGPGGLEIDGAGDPAQLPGLPRTSLSGDDGLTLRRQASNAWEEGSQLYLSDEVVALADLRAAKEYQRTSREETQCTRCSRDYVGAGADAVEILSGDLIAVFPDDPNTLGALYRPSGSTNEPSARMASLELEIPSVRWDISPSTRQEPTRNPSLGSGEVAPGTLLHSGEFTHDVTDLYVKGVGIDFAFTRSYRNQTIGSGPLGPGWDHAYRLRLRELPNGDVELYDGRGRRETYTRIVQPDGFWYQEPKGRFDTLRKTAEGFTIFTEAKAVIRFDRFGRLLAIADANKQRRHDPGSGTEIAAFYDARSRLVRLESHGRHIHLEYDDAGRIEAVEDYTGRRWSYGYDAGGRLVEASVDVTRGVWPSGGGGTLTTSYAYTPVEGSLAERLTRRDNLSRLVDARGGEPWLRLDWGSPAGDGRTEHVVEQHWGGDRWGSRPVRIAYNFSSGLTTVDDRRDSRWTYRHTSIEDGRRLVVTAPALTAPEGVPDAPSGAIVTTIDYDNEGLVSKVESPSGRIEEMSYWATSGDGVGAARRIRGRIDSWKIVPGSDGPNGSPAVLEQKSLKLQPGSGLPLEVQALWGMLTKFGRDDQGNAESVTRAAGTEWEATERVAWTALGQPERFTDGGNRVTTLEYFSEAPRIGYLERAVRDPGGLGLTTRFETDERGNVTAVIDPAGVRTEYDYNEVDWLVAERHAVGTGVERELRYTFDAAGQLRQTEEPYGTSAAAVRSRTEYGVLGEVTKTERETVPGGLFVSATIEYDGAFDPVREVGPSGEVARTERDARGWPVRRVIELGEGENGEPSEAVEAFAHDVEGRIVARVDEDGFVWRRGYDGYGRLASERDPLETVILHQYPHEEGEPPQRRRRVTTDGAAYSFEETIERFDPLERPFATTRRLWNGLDGEAVDATWLTVHDSAGNLERTIDPYGFGSWLEYDAAGRLVRVDEHLSTDQPTRPGSGRVVRQLTLDAAGNVASEQVAEATPGGAAATTVRYFTYDPLGRRVGALNGLGDFWSWSHDRRGNVISAVEPGGIETTMVWDGLDRLVSVAAPDGGVTLHQYDSSSRLSALIDPRGNSTGYVYDPRGLPKLVTYANGAAESYTYDGRGNTIGRIRPDGTTIVQAFDSRGLMATRAVTPASGPTVQESYVFDRLGRMTKAIAGTVETRFEYDSYSRRTAEQTHVPGRPVRRVSFGFDVVGNQLWLEYPSGERVVTYDPDQSIGRPLTIGWGGEEPQEKATYDWRGADLPARTSRGVLQTTTGYDGARRPVVSDTTVGGGGLVVGEAVAWSPRGLRSEVRRRDLNLAGYGFDYDPNGRLVSSQATRSLRDRPRHYGFGYDSTDNLLAMTSERECESDERPLPLDGSGRNRPGSVGPRELTWHQNGSLARKGDLELHYDWSNRLLRVDQDGVGTIASYEYDALGRRITESSGGVVREVVWAGWQAIEVYRGPDLAERRTYGLGLDEVVSLERWSSAGAPVQEHTPIYGSGGHVVMLVEAASGRPVEAYEYSPYGERSVYVNDLMPPVIDQLRIAGDEIWVEISEEVLLEEVSPGITLENLTLGVTLPALVSQPVLDGRNAGRRLAIRADLPATAAEGQPTWPPRPGEQLRVAIAGASLVDVWGNRTAPEAGASQVVAWTGDQVVLDTAAPRVLRVCVTADGRIEIELSEEVASSSLGAITVGGQTIAWTTSASGYLLRSTQALASGSHVVAIGAALEDLAGTAMTEGWSGSVEVVEGEPTLAWAAPWPGAVATTTVGNWLGFHGLPHDPVTGLVYARNRDYDPQMGRFIQTDPLGHVDSVSLYQYGLNNPVNFSDPTGMAVETPWDLLSLGIGGASLWYNLKHGHLGLAAVDAVGVGLDAVSAAVPVLPGGWGVAIKASRAAGALGKAQLSVRTFDVAQGGVEAVGAAAAGDYGWAALYGGMSALGGRGVARSNFSWRVGSSPVASVGGAGGVQIRSQVALPTELSIQRQLALLTRETRDAFLADDRLLERYLRRGEIDAIVSEPWRMRLFFGTAVERRVATLVAADPELSRMLRHTANNAPQDFIGPGGMGYELTGASWSSILEHAARKGVDSVVTYPSIPSGFGREWVSRYLK